MKIKTSKTGEGAKGQASRTSLGFTLLETVVSMPIAAITLVALYACFGQGFNVIGQSREDLRATQIMLKQCERLRLCPFDQLTNSAYNPRTFTEYYDPVDRPAGGGTPYTVTFTPSVPASGTLPESYRTNMLQITVGVTWKTGKLQHTRSMPTFVARNGIQSFVATGK